MCTQPLISLIIPVYNVEQYLDACIESVLAQTYQNLEILLVDDGAKDHSGSLCDNWAQKDKRIRVIHQENKGLSGARNTALDQFQGEYVMFIDSDDVISPMLCQVLYDALAQGGDVAICDPVHIFPDKPWSYRQATRTVSMDATEAISKMWYQTAFLPSAWGKLYRANLFRTRRFTPGRLFEDIDIMHEVLFDAEKIVYTDAQLYGYLHRENSITTKSFGQRDLDILLIAEKILAFSKDKPELEDPAKAYAVTAALRVFLNAPKNDAFHDGILQANALIAQYGKAVAKDPHIRKKNRYALSLYFFCKPLMRFVYKFINRWK